MIRSAVVTVAAILMVAIEFVRAPPPLRLTIDCSQGNTDCKFARKAIDLRGHRIKPNTVCDFLHNAIPKAVRDGKFVLVDDDQNGSSNNQISFNLPPPRSFEPKLGSRFRSPRINVSKFTVPKLRASKIPLKAPKIGSSMFKFDASEEETNENDSSAERTEKFRKGVQKMLHVVKVLGQVDQYLSERTRIMVDAIAKLFAE